MYQLRRRLLSRIPARRVEAVKTLGRSGERAVLGDLKKMVADRYAAVSEQAATSLGMVGGKRALTYLEQLEKFYQSGKLEAL